jgi:hypothetical protein
MATSMVLLTLDAGSVLYNPQQMPREIVLKHKDGELIKSVSEGGGWGVLRRDEFDINFMQDGGYRSPITAAGTLADRQAFGFRVNGESVNPLTYNPAPSDVETVEIEPLNLGGVMVQDIAQLPFGVYTTQEVYYRAYVRQPTEEGRVDGGSAVLEKRLGPGGKWDEIASVNTYEAEYLIDKIAEETQMEAVSGSAAELQDRLDAELFKASHTAEDQAHRNLAAIQDKTCFSPNHPKPRPIDFPEE